MWSLVLLTSGNFASASEDRSIKIWSTSTETLLHTLSGHTAAVYGLAALSGNGLASVGADGYLRIWDATAGGAETRSVSVSALNGLTAVAKLSTGNVAVAVGDFSIKVYNPADVSLVSTFAAGHTAVINFLLSLSNGDLASASGDTSVKIWNTADGSLRRTLTGHSDEVMTLKEIGSDLASGSKDDKIKIWDVSTGLEKKTINVASDVYSVEYLRSLYVTSGSTNGWLEFWDKSSGSKYKTNYVGSNILLSQLTLPSGNLVVGDSVGTIKILKF